MYFSFIKYFAFLITVFLLIQSNCKAQNTDSLFAIFKTNIDAQDNCIDMDEETEIVFYTILDISSAGYLVKLTNDENPAIRAMMFSGLVMKNSKYSILEEVYSQHIHDSAKYTYCPTDLVIEWSVNEFMKFALQRVKEKKSPKVDFKERIKNSVNKLNNNPRIIIPGARFNKIKRSEFIKVDSLIISNIEYQIVSFTLTDGIKVEVSKSNRVTDEMKKIILKTPRNRIYIEDVRVKGQNNEVRVFGGLGIKIEDDE